MSWLLFGQIAALMLWAAILAIATRNSGPKA